MRGNDEYDGLTTEYVKRVITQKIVRYICSFFTSILKHGTGFAFPL